MPRCPLSSLLLGGVLLGSPATAAVTSSRAPAVPTVWTAAAPMPLSDAAESYGHAQCDDQPNSFYVIGGVDETLNYINKAWRYDADTDTWNALAPVPGTPVEGAAAVCHQGFIYVAGGFFASMPGGGTTNQLFIYDVANDTWSAGADVPRHVWAAAMGAFGGQLYLIGGQEDNYLPLDSIEVDIYDIATNTWTGTGAPMPSPLLLAGWTQIGPYVYVVGGYANSFPVNSNLTLRYDMSANTWTLGPTFTSARAALALAATSQFLYAIGGDANGGGLLDPTALVERLDHTAFPAGAWTDTADPLPLALFEVSAGFCTSAVAGGEVWTLDGVRLPFPTLESVNLYRPSEPCPPGGPPAPVVVKTGATLTVEGCGPANGSIDPGEIVTVDFALRNIGSAATINVVATLQASGGVTPITTSQTYGVLIAGGPAVSQPFTFAAAGACGGTLTASLAVQDGATNLGTKTFTFTLGTSSTTGTATFSNPAPITINDAAPATPYPSDITVSGLTDTVSKVTVTLTGITHTFPSDIDILLVGPSGQGMVVLSDVGGGFDITDVTITLDDAAGAQVPIPIVDGTYWPADVWRGDPFPPPAPPGPHGIELSFFDGIDPNGAWSLYVVDAGAGDAGSISGGWSMTITTAVPVCCQSGLPQISIGDVTLPEGDVGPTTASFPVTLSAPSGSLVSVDFATADGTATTADNDYLQGSGTLSFNPGQTSATLAVSVVGDTTFEPDETFLVNLSNPVGATILDGIGVGTILNDDKPLATATRDELIHDSRETRDLDSISRFWRIIQKGHSSYEVIVDAATGDIGASGPDLLRIDSDGTTVLQIGTSTTGGSSKSLRFENPIDSSIDNQFIRVRSAACVADCDQSDTFRIRAYDTTYRIARWNNSATQTTLVVIANPTNQVVNGKVSFYQASTGNLVAVTTVSIPANGSIVFFAGIVGQSGSAIFSNDAGYGQLTGKAVAVEPATGFTFDTAMVPRED